MRNIGLFSFGVTTCVLVPAAISRLTAGPQQVGKLVAPGAQTIEIGGATIEASLDRAMVDPGDSIHLKLTASEAKTKRIALGVVVYGSSGTEGGRVPNPPVDVAHETVTLDIDTHGKATKDVKLKLEGARAFQEPFAHYTVYVMPPKAADRLVYLRDRTRVIPGTKEEPIPSYNKSGERFMSLYYSVQRADPPDDAPQLFAPGEIARLEAHARAKSSAVAITAPSETRVGQPYTVAVTVKNPTGHKLADVEVSLATPAGLLEEGYTGLRDEAVDVEPASIKVDLGRHESKRIEFKVTPKVVGVLGLYAHASAPEDDIAAFEAGAVEATDVHEARSESIVGAR